MSTDTKQDRTSPVPRSWLGRKLVALNKYKLLAGLLILGPLAAAIAYAATVAAPGHGASAAMAAVIACAAPSAIGGLLGFLFGIPRTLTGDQVPAPDAKPGSRRTRTNTNLEQISDWLTKIFIGVGLSQLGSIPEHVRSVAEFVGQAMGNTEGVFAVVGAMLVYFAVAGFLAGYLITRLVLARVFDEAERPPEDIVDRLSHAPEMTGAGSGVSQRDVEEMLKFRLQDLETNQQKLAWARAKLESGEPEVAANTLQRLASNNPSDFNVVASSVLTSLYGEWPQSFERAIRIGTEYLDTVPQPTPAHARLMAYLVLAYGQRYTWTKGEDLPRAQESEQKAVQYAKQAIKLDPSLKGYLLHFARPASDDDDLVELAANSLELQKELGLT